MVNAGTGRCGDASSCRTCFIHWIIECWHYTAHDACTRAEKVVEQLSSKTEFVPILRKRLAGLKREQEQRDEQLDRLLDLVAGTSELQTLLAGLNDMGRIHNVAITTTKPGDIERFQPLSLQTQGQVAPPAAGGGDSRAGSSDPLLNRSLEKHSVSLTVTGSFQKILEFLQSLEQLQAFMVVSEMNIERQRQSHKKMLTL